MKYYAIKNQGYIAGVGTGVRGTEITEAEYDSIVGSIRNRPTPPEGYGYRLTEGLEWELYELPAAEEDDPDLTAEEALDIIMGGDSDA